MIEYAYTIHSPNKITEHRRLNLRLFYIKLKDVTYERKKGWNSFLGISLPMGYVWFKVSGGFNYEANKRLKNARLNPPYLKTIN